MKSRTGETVAINDGTNMRHFQPIFMRFATTERLGGVIFHLDWATSAVLHSLPPKWFDDWTSLARVSLAQGLSDSVFVTELT